MEDLEKKHEGLPVAAPEKTVGSPQMGSSQMGRTLLAIPWRGRGGDLGTHQAALLGAAT